MISKIKIGTRGSRLALWQTEYVQTRLKTFFPDLEIERVIVKTLPDSDQVTAIHDMGGKAVFVRELEEALLSRHIDMAVHSLKDMSAVLPKGLTRGAYMGGDSRYDVFLNRHGAGFQDVPKGAAIACGSQRRLHQLKQLREDVRYVPIRGNVDTRIRKLEEGNYDGMILAHAGLQRLQLLRYVTHVFNISDMVPAAGQGIIAVEARETDQDILGILAGINDESHAYLASIEFALMAEMGAGCQTPLGVYAVASDRSVTVYLFLSLENGYRLYHVSDAAHGTRPEVMAKNIATYVRHDYHERMKEELIL